MMAQAEFLFAYSLATIAYKAEAVGLFALILVIRKVSLSGSY